MKVRGLGLALWMIFATVPATSATASDIGATTLSSSVSGIGTESSEGSPNLQVTEVQAVPEPETWALFFGGILLGLFWNQVRVQTKRRW